MLFVNNRKKYSKCNVTRRDKLIETYVMIMLSLFPIKNMQQKRLMKRLIANTEK